MSNLIFTLFKGVSNKEIDRWSLILINAMSEFKINDNRDQAIFLAHCFYHSDGFGQIKENFNHTTTILLTIYADKIALSEAYELGERANKSANEKEIAICIYNKYNGNNNSNDCWKYRSRGLLPIRGINAYRKCSEYFKLDLVNNPHFLESDYQAARSAAWLYTYRGCLHLSDDIASITRAIHGNCYGLAERIRIINSLTNHLK